MARKRVRSRINQPKAKPFIWTPWLTVAAVLIIFPITGFTFAASMESRDSFCGSCHTQPESTYLQRSTASQQVDLASYHTGQNTRCIDCHSGRGIVGRVGAELMGAGNAFKWFTKTAVQPAPLNYPITDAHCLKCHQQVTSETYVPQNQTLKDLGDAQNGHWHVFLPRWQAQVSNAGSCVTCHSSHTTTGDPKLLYLIDQPTSDQCDACHKVLRREGEG